MIILPKGAFAVLPDKKEEKTQSGIYLGPSEQKEPDTGIITYTSEELNKYQGLKVRYRPDFGENIEIGNTQFKYFRDLNSSIYYIINENKK